MSEVLVIGGGPAGVIAACRAAERGHSVRLLEKNAKIGRKLLITGKGRCNLTNYCTELSELIDKVATNGNFLYSAFSAFMPADTISLFEGLGVPLKLERGKRVFPVSDRSEDIVDALFSYMKKTGVSLLRGRATRLIKAEEDGPGKHSERIKGVLLDSGELLSCDAVVLATGGLSYPKTGSSGEGYLLAKEAGHCISRLSPSLVPIESKEPFCKRLEGLSLRNVKIAVEDCLEGGKIVHNDFGEMLFTHFGVSGPLILSASSHIREMSADRYVLHINLKPALSGKQLDDRIKRDFEAASNREFKNSLGKLLPKKLIPVIEELSGIEPSTKVNQITREQRLSLCRLLSDFKIRLYGFRPIEEAVITSGGIKVAEINPSTMESKLVKGLYFAGEIIDTDAYTGGFNLQIAFSTGFLAGSSIR